MLPSLSDCRIGNEYAGFDEFRAWARTEPTMAIELIWQKLLSGEDPGHDDHALCFELGNLIVEIGQEIQFQNRLVSEWESISDDLRSNFLMIGACPSIFDAALISWIIECESTTAANQHRLMSVLATSRFEELKGQFLTWIGRCREYDDPVRQETFKRFLDRLSALL